MRGDICVAVEAAHLSVGHLTNISAHSVTAFPTPRSKKEMWRCALNLLLRILALAQCVS